MAIPSFFKQNKPRGFNYIPRYFDPEKEERDQKHRVREIVRQSREGEPAGSTPGESAAAGNGQEAGQPYRSKIMRGDMKNYFHRSRERVEKHTIIRLLVIILIIVLVVYIYLRFL
jgi:hypothetical protein